MTMKEAVIKAYETEFSTKLFSNNQEPRVSGQEFGADSNKKSLSFNEFLSSYFGVNRLSAVKSDFDIDWTFNDELEHIYYVLHDHKF